MKGVISVGEALIDFIPLDADNATYQKSPGGAPANVAVGVARLGGKSTFLGKVGNDLLGHFLKETLQGHGVDVGHMLLTDEARTGVVFVTLDPNGERSFSFYINPSADRFLHESELDERLFQANKILHFGSISLIGEPSKTAVRQAVRLARQFGMMVSYDPNLRLSLWESEEQARQTILSMLTEVDVLKISEEELAFLTGKADIEQGIRALDPYQIPLLFVTLGAEGSFYCLKGIIGKVPAIQVDVVDTTGAGDAFVSGILYMLNETDKPIAGLTLQEVESMVRFSSVSGGLAATKKGAMTALPTLDEVREILARQAK